MPELLTVELPTQTRLNNLGVNAAKVYATAHFPPYWKILCFLPLTLTVTAVFHVLAGDGSVMPGWHNQPWSQHSAALSVRDKPPVWK